MKANNDSQAAQKKLKKRKAALENSNSLRTINSANKLNNAAWLLINVALIFQSAEAEKAAR